MPARVFCNVKYLQDYYHQYILFLSWASCSQMAPGDKQVITNHLIVNLLLTYYLTYGFMLTTKSKAKELRCF